MSAILLAISSSALYGAADFFGGFASRLISVLLVALIANVVAAILFVGLAGIYSPYSLSVNDIKWSVGAGLFMGSAAICLYHSLSIGRMSVVAPITAICAILLPVASDLIFGVNISTLSKGGIFLASISIVLIAQERKTQTIKIGQVRSGLIQKYKSILYAVLAGLGIGVFYIFTKQTSTNSGLWPLLIIRMVSILITFTAILVAKKKHSQEIRWAKSGVLLACLVGILDAFANTTYLLAVREGQLSIVATLTSLYPASTLLLARLVLKEKLNAIQIAGLTLTAVAIIMIVK